MQVGVKRGKRTSVSLLNIQRSRNLPSVRTGSSQSNKSAVSASSPDRPDSAR